MSIESMDWQTKFLTAKELLQPPARELPVQHHTPRAVHRVHVKMVLAQINPHSGYLAHGPRRSCGLDAFLLALPRPKGSGADHPISQGGGAPGPPAGAS